MDKLRFLFELYLKKLDLPHIPLYLKRIEYPGNECSYLRADRIEDNNTTEKWFVPKYIRCVIIPEHFIIDRRNGKVFGVKLDSNYEKCIWAMFHELGHYYHRCRYPNTFHKYLGTQRLEDFADVMACKFYKEYQNGIN